jgi:hypothetical protein
MNNEQKDQSLPSASLAQNGMLSAGVSNRQTYIKYGRKSGLSALKLLIENLNGEPLKAAQDAYNYLDGCLRHDRAKGKGRYACR